MASSGKAAAACCPTSQRWRTWRSAIAWSALTMWLILDPTLLTAVGITPGGIGITETGTAAALVAFGANPAEAGAADLAMQGQG